MTAGAAVGIDDLADPLALASDVFGDAVALGPRAGEITLGRHLHQGVPVLCRIVMGSRLFVRCDNRFQVDDLAGCRLDLRRVHEAIATDPHVVVAARQVGHEVAALVVGHHALDQTGWRGPGFRDHPDPCLRSLRASHHAADIVVIDGDGLPSAGSLASAYHCERSHHAPRHGKRHDPPIEAFRTHTPFSFTENAVRLRGGCQNPRDM